jgi:hypothetical protein
VERKNYRAKARRIWILVEYRDGRPEDIVIGVLGRS